MAATIKDLGKVTAYAYAKAAGYTGTEEQFQAIFNEFTENAPGLIDRMDTAVARAEAAVTNIDATVQDAVDDAVEEATASAVATANQAVTDAQAAQTAAEGAVTQANNAVTQANAAVTAAQAAQSAAEDAAESFVLDRTLTDSGAAAPADLVGDLKESIIQIEQNGFVDLISPLNDYYEKDSVAAVTENGIVLNGSAWSGGIKYKIAVTENTDYIITYTLKGSGISLISIYDANNTKISDTAISVGDAAEFHFNSGTNNIMYVWFRIGGQACVNFEYANLKLTQVNTAYKELKTEIEKNNSRTVGYINYFKLDEFVGKTNGAEINNNSIILNGNAWGESITYKFSVDKNSTYAIRFKITSESGVSVISVSTSPNTSNIETVVINTSRSAVTFNTGNNETIYVRFRIGDLACVNYTYSDIELIKINDFNDAFIKKNGFGKTIYCWGDSIMAGAGASQSVSIDGLAEATIPSALAKLLNYSYPNSFEAYDGNEGAAVINMGVGGENSRTILCRLGALLMTVNNIAIPSEGSVSFNSIQCTDGNNVYPLHQNWMGSKIVFNKCFIAGIEGSLTYSGPETETESETGTYTFTRTQSGESVVIDRPTGIISPVFKRYGDILVLEIGHNGGWDNDLNILVNQYKMAIEKAETDRYIIIGNTSGDETFNADWDKALQIAFQRHFLNVREYITTPIYNNGVVVNCYGLADRGMTPTEDDLTKIANGEIPMQLKVDSAHFNSYGYYTIGEQVYKRGVELGYW